MDFILAALNVKRRRPQLRVWVNPPSALGTCGGAGMASGGSKGGALETFGGAGMASGGSRAARLRHSAAQELTSRGGEPLVHLINSG